MAVRGIVAIVDLYAPLRTINDPPLYSFQNYFPETLNLFGGSYEYNSFTLSAFPEKRDSSGADPFDIQFVATSANVDLVEAAIANRYELVVGTLVWSSDIENPTSGDFVIYGLRTGAALSGSSDFTSVVLTCGEYGDSVQSDIPFRKIPWTILGPLSFRR